jgi:hypothetical protein
LTPSARSANLIAGDGTKNGLPAPNKELASNQKQLLEQKPHTSSNPAPSTGESTANLTFGAKPFVPIFLREAGVLVENNPYGPTSFCAPGITGTSDEFLLTATVQNLKKLARLLVHSPPISVGCPG